MNNAHPAGSLTYLKPLLGMTRMTKMRKFPGAALSPHGTNITPFMDVYFFLNDRPDGRVVPLVSIIALESHPMVQILCHLWIY
jgi:hypothetical protein